LRTSFRNQLPPGCRPSESAADLLRDAASLEPVRRHDSHVRHTAPTEQLQYLQNDLHVYLVAARALGPFHAGREPRRVSQHERRKRGAERVARIRQITPGRGIDHACFLKDVPTHPPPGYFAARQHDGRKLLEVATHHGPLGRQAGSDKQIRQGSRAGLVHQK
jgi:hypothetical protein